VEDAFPVAEVLLAERGVEAIGVAQGRDIGGGGAFAEHLLDGISGDEMDEEKDKADHQPDDRQGVEDALEESSQWSVLGSGIRGQGPVCESSSVVILSEAKDLCNLPAARHSGQSAQVLRFAQDDNAFCR
jgi:hypothetical protein